MPERSQSVLVRPLAVGISQAMLRHVGCRIRSRDPFVNICSEQFLEFLSKPVVAEELKRLLAADMDKRHSTADSAANMPEHGLEDAYSERPN
jgi:hypothetical protein